MKPTDTSEKGLKSSIVASLPKCILIFPLTLEDFAMMNQNLIENTHNSTLIL